MWIHLLPLGLIDGAGGGEPVVSATLAGGRGSKDRKRRAFIEIDGQRFEVNSMEEARRLFAIAAQETEEAARQALKSEGAVQVPRNVVRVIGKSTLAKEIRVELPRYVMTHWEIPQILPKRYDDEEEVLMILLGM